nr:stomatal closure-related actin-binding protein 1 [Quercus suber]
MHSPYLHRRLRRSTVGLDVPQISSPLSALQDPATNPAFVVADPSLKDPAFGDLQSRWSEIMTRVTRDFGDTMQKEAVPAVSAEVMFNSSRFPNYKIGANNQIVDATDDPKVLSMKEVVARETAQLLEQQKRLSVRDLASKFEKGLAAAAKLSEEARLREAASLEKHVLLKKLRDALESLKGRVAGRNKDDVEEAICMVEALAVQLTQREGELIQEKAEVKKLANFLKQASEDAKKLVDEERAFARAEIENARAAVQRVEEALQEHERTSRASGKQDVEELMKEVQEARRIIMLHQPSKVMDMELELRALRTQLLEKSKHSLRLQKELAKSKRVVENGSQSFELDGHEALGSYLRIQPCSNNAPELSKCSIQWYRVSPEAFGDLQSRWSEIMTRVTRDFGDTMQKEAVPAVSADVMFNSSRFPNYKIGANNQIVDATDDPKVLSMKEVVARETAQLLEQQKRLSVRDLASKFEKGLAAAAKLSEEARLREAASLEKHVLLKKLRDALESLKGRVAGRNKDDVEEAICMVEALAVQLTQREGELIQEKAEVKKLANFLKQASEDAKKLVDEERAFARAEIENARAAVQRVEEALQEHERTSRASGKQDVEELMKEVQEARRIIMLHQPSKVMDMELELRALRTQLLEKSKHSLRLQKELAKSKRVVENGSQSFELDGHEALGSYLRIQPCSNLLLAKSKRVVENGSQSFELDGHEALGSYLRIQPCSDNAPELSKCSIQWYRVSSEGGKKELISGATKSVYAPEPFDVGRILQADIVWEGQQITLTTAGPIDPAAGLGSHVEALVRRHDIEFNVVVTQMNGVNHPSESIHVLHVGRMRIKLCKGKTTIAKEYYSTSMQLCGVRGGGNAAAQALFWQAKKGLSFVVAFESERERNAAIMLARRFAFDCNIMLAGPDDRAPLGT